MVAAAVGGAAVLGAVGSYISADQQADAASGAARTQADAAVKGIEEQRRQFDAIQALLKPFVTAGTGALSGQQALLGTSGPEAQQAAINALQKSPQFTSLLDQGENAMRQNAAATGGLRGGNFQSALAQFRPQLLAQTINDQYGRLSGLTNTGLGAATQTGAFGQASAGNVSNLLEQQGAAVAGGQLARGEARADQTSAIFSGLGGLLGAF